MELDPRAGVDALVGVAVRGLRSVDWSRPRCRLADRSLFG